MMVPAPLHAGQVCWIEKKPCCMRTWPAPPQVPQAVGEVPGLAPLPPQLPQPSGREISIEAVRCNPFTLSATVRGLSVPDRDGLTLAARPARVITPVNNAHRYVLMATERGRLQDLIFDNRVLWRHRALAAVLFEHLPVLAFAFFRQPVRAQHEIEQIAGVGKEEYDQLFQKIIPVAFWFL